MEAIDQATLAALLASAVVLVNKISAYIDKLAAKKNGGDVYSNVKDARSELNDARSQIESLSSRVNMIETQVVGLGKSVGDMETKLERFHRDMMEFREESRINAASIRSYLQGKKEGETNG